MIRMKLRITIIFSIMLISAKLFAQPGGGGGLEIDGLYNKNLEAIDILSDTSLKIRTFILATGAVQEETFFNEKIIGGNRYYYSKFSLGYPGIDADHRMYIVYKKDTMIVDFAEIMSPNGGGSRDHMDSLVIQNGYFKYCRSDDQHYQYYGYENYKNKICLEYGFTPFTVKQLVSTGYIYYDSTIDLSFIDERNLTASYFLRNAEYYLRNNQAEPALTNIAKAIEKSNGNKNCETLYLLCDAYTKAGQYEDALETILLATNCRRYSWHGYLLSNNETKTINYKIRIDLFIKLKQYDNALRDYDSLYHISDNHDKIRINVGRTDFKIDYLKDYTGAITDLKKIIDAMSGTILCYNHEGSDRYSSVYFSLARAEYLIGDKQSAYKHWLQAEDLRYRPLSLYSAVIHFDSIINKHPTVPELYLCRSLAYSGLEGYLGWQEEIWIKALNDIDAAETLGMNDYRINLYRASVLNKLKKYNEAMKEIDLAILKNNTYPGCFSLRYKIRNNLKQTKWNDDTDVDLIQLRKLAQDWTWQR